MVFKIINSTTKLLPAWKAILQELGLPDITIPRDVRTRWNSTYDMLKETVKYARAYDRLCNDKANDLRAYELSAGEWAIARELLGVLKACVRANIHALYTNYGFRGVFRFSRMQPPSSHEERRTSRA